MRADNRGAKVKFWQETRYDSMRLPESPGTTCPAVLFALRAFSRSAASITYRTISGVSSPPPVPVIFCLPASSYSFKKHFFVASNKTAGRRTQDRRVELAPVPEVTKRASTTRPDDRLENRLSYAMWPVWPAYRGSRSSPNRVCRQHSIYLVLFRTNL